MASHNSLFDNQRSSFGDVLPDKWLATSSLQKAIRRGNAAAALTATSFLLGVQPGRFWRRLVVIALEDIGVADVGLVRETLLTATRKTVRARLGGDRAAAGSLVQRLCAAPKCRDACELLVAADLHPRLQKERTAFIDLTRHQLCDFLADPTQQLPARTLAAWLLAGTKRFPAYALPEIEGDFRELLDIYAHLGVPDDVLDVARLDSRSTREGHPVSWPLVWLKANERPASIEPATLPSSPTIHGWPAEAYDMHTRLGKRALNLFARRCTALVKMMDRHLPPQSHADFIGSLAFRAEGHLVDRRLVYPGAAAILSDAETAHLTYSGFPASLVADALAIVSDHLELLHQCRLDVVRGKL